MHRSMTTAAAGLAVLTMTACGAGDPPAPERSLNAVYALVASTGIDYEPQRTTRGLAARSALVVEGTVAGVSEGRSIGDPELDLPPRSTVLLRVSVQETHKGTRQQAVLVELPSEGSTAADFAAVLPSDLRVLVYAVPARGPNPGEQVVTVSPEWRAAARVWQPTSPQGLVVSDGTAVLTPLNDLRFPGTTLAAFRPAAGPYPPGVPLR